MSAHAAGVVVAASAAGASLATAESLTAGQVAAALADVPGASAVLQGGVVAYQNHVKSGVLGVDAALLAERGAVDPEVARQMAAGARRVLGADVGVATTGVAGPEPHQGKPVGTVFVGLAVGPDLVDALAALGGAPGAPAPDGGAAAAFALDLPGDRAAVRRASTDRALELLRGLWSTAGE